MRPGDWHKQRPLLESTKQRQCNLRKGLHGVGGQRKPTGHAEVTKPVATGARRQAGVGKMGTGWSDASSEPTS